ncbi:MAG TPA: hypothetical protein VIW68_02725 [Candidatus Sulfotelmatobacter sp.]
MSTTPVASNSLFQQLQSFYKQRQSDLKQLGQALQSGDLNGAQQLFNALQTLGQSGPFANADPFSNSQREQDFAAIGQALQSGDLAGAQQAFAALEQTFHPRSQSNNPGGSIGPAVIVNLGGPTGVSSIPPVSTPSGRSGTSTGPSGVSSPGPEIIINVGANAGGPEQLTIDVNNSGHNGAEQLSISLGTQQNPASQDQITLNISPNSNEQIVLNLLNGQASSPSPNSNGLSVVA